MRALPDNCKDDGEKIFPHFCATVSAKEDGRYGESSRLASRAVPLLDPLASFPGLPHLHRFQYAKTEGQRLGNLLT